VILLASGTAEAQTRPRFDIFGLAGSGHVTEDDGFLGSGPSFGGGVDWFLTDHTYIEFELVHQRINRDFEFHITHYPPGVTDPASREAVFIPMKFERRGGATFLSGALGHLMGSGSVQPFIQVEAGLMTYDGLETSSEYLQPPPAGYAPMEPLTGRSRGIGTAFTFGGNTGVRIGGNARWFVRPHIGLRLAAVENTGPKYIVRFGAAGGWRW
jgi:hypothetical protein